MEWVEVFSVFIVCHLVGDFLLQTDWQARTKYGGLGADLEARRALFTHVMSYGIVFVPAFVWLAGEIGGWVIGIAVLVLVPHLVQDDGRLLHRYARTVKRSSVEQGDLVAVAVDQSFHLLALFAVALLAVS
jgi:hypothetical protein